MWLNEEHLSAIGAYGPPFICPLSTLVLGFSVLTHLFVLE